MSDWIEDGYPTDAALKKISEWKVTGEYAMRECIEFVMGLWSYQDRVEEIQPRVYFLSTGGWSGNESIIGAMQDNTMLWLFTYAAYLRGGHWFFVVPGGKWDIDTVMAQTGIISAIQKRDEI